MFPSLLLLNKCLMQLQLFSWLLMMVLLMLLSVLLLQMMLATPMMRLLVLFSLSKRRVRG